MNKFLDKSVLCLILITIAAGYLQAQESSDNNQSTKSPFFFDITYKNGGKNSKHLTKVGIKIDKYNGGHCVGAGGKGDPEYNDVLLPLTDYVVRFYVDNGEIIVAADPPIEIMPDRAARFTISYFPSSVSSCAKPWFVEISGILIFDSGEKYYTDPQLIRESDVEKYQQRTVADTEILTALRSRNIELRRQAFSKLPTSTLDKESIKFIIKTGLDSEDTAIRIEAARADSKMGFKLFAKKIAYLLSISQDDAEIETYCETLGEVKDPDTIDILISLLKNLKLKYYSSAREALIKLNHPDVIIKVRPLLIDNFRWAISKDLFLHRRYFELCKIVIAYRDEASVRILLDLKNYPIYSSISSKLVSEVYKIINENQIIRDPFVLAMRPLFEKALTDSDPDARHKALKVLCYMPINDNTLQKILKNGFRDSEEKNRILSAQLAAELDYKLLADHILSLLKASKSEQAKASYCESLKKLKMPCE